MKNFCYRIGKYIAKADKILWLCGLLLSGLSVVLMFSICKNDGFVSSGDKLFYTQLIAVIIGIAAAVWISLIDHKRITSRWKILALVGIVLMLLTFTPLGSGREGADDKAWLSVFGLFDFQPSEIVKIIFVFTFALHLSKVKSSINKFATLILVVLHGMVPIGLVIAQGDFGSALVFVAIFLFMLFSAGISWKYIASGAVSSTVILPLIYFFLLDTHHRERIIIAFNPDIAPQGMGYQQVQGKIALGSGQMYGRGLFSDKLIRTIPEVYNDFIFSYIGQTLGFIGCVAVILVISVLCFRILSIAVKATDDVRKLVAMGIFAMFLVQSVLNIGMVLCVAPVIGVTLPFLSSGGSSMIVSFIALGIISKSKKDYS